jgi:peptidyl-prolyl cis-trans isomerase B (cyclophilin B)
MKKTIKILAFVFAFMFVLASCNGTTDNNGSTEASTKDPYATEYVPEFVTNLNLTSDKIDNSEKKTDVFSSDDSAPEITDAETTENADTQESQPVGSVNHPKVKFTMENGGSFVVELYPEYAPATCANFVKLVNEGFYDGLTFHRVIRGFMAQGGDPDGNGTGGSSETIPGEFYSNGFDKNIISHTRGVISMARSSNPDSASSQFFICYDDCSDSLDGSYAAFGLVIEGMDVVDDFLLVERTLGSDRALSKPVTPIIIAKAEVVG